MKTKNLHINFFLIIIFSSYLSFFSCAPAYVPNVVNVPLLSNRGETQVAAYMGLSGFDFQFATAPANHFGIILNSSFMNNRNDPQDNYHKHIFAEGGIGYFNKNKGNLTFEVFGGLGYGIIDVSTVFLNVPIVTKATLSRIFLQPQIGVSTKFFEVSFALRSVLLNSVSDIDNTKEANIYFFEPVITFDIGFKNVYLQLQGGISKSLGTDIPTWFTYQPIIFSMGIHFKFGKIRDVQPRYY